MTAYPRECICGCSKAKEAVIQDIMRTEGLSAAQAEDFFNRLGEKL